MQIETLRKSLKDKDAYYHAELVKKQTDTDRDLMELRRVMDKIDMSHHERFEKMVQQHEEEIGNTQPTNQIHFSHTNITFPAFQNNSTSNQNRKW